MNATEKTKTAAEFLADFVADRAKLEATAAYADRWMMIWDYPGSALFMGVDAMTGRAFATGFRRAYSFQTEDKAKAFVERNRVRNGRDEAPTPITMVDAKARQLADLDGVIATFKTMEG